MPDQEATASLDTRNEINASVQSGHIARTILDPEESPEDIQKRYLAKAGQYFFRDRNNAMAFEDKGPRIATQAEDPMVAASMVELAVAKGWKALKVTGSESFRRTIWLEATKRGMAVRGYEPKPQDELQLKEILANTPQTPSVHAIASARAKAFSEQPQEEALRTYRELQRAYAGRTSIYQWIDANIPNSKKQIELRAAVDHGIAERLAKGEIPSVVVLPSLKAIDPKQINAIHKQAVVMGAVAKAKGHPPQVVRIVIAAAERFGRHLADKGVWIPEPLVYDRHAPPRQRPTFAKDDTSKPEIQRQPKIQPRR